MIQSSVLIFIQIIPNVKKQSTMLKKKKVSHQGTECKVKKVLFRDSE